MTLPNPFPGKVNPHASARAGSNGTLIVMLLDNSGSMRSVLSDTIGGFNSYVATTKDETTNMSLYTFCSQRQTKFTNRPSKLVYDLKDYGYKADGPSTALVDAFVETIKDTDTYLNSINPDERPTVIFVVFTDGQENSSYKYTKETLQAMVQERTELGWDFTYLGANVDAFDEARKLGISVTKAAAYNQAQNMCDAFVAAANYTSRVRSARDAGLDSTQVAYTTEERTKMGG